MKDVKTRHLPTEMICPDSRSVGIRTVLISPHSLKNSVKLLRICSRPQLPHSLDLMQYNETQSDWHRVWESSRPYNRLYTNMDWTYIIFIIISVKPLNESSFARACPWCSCIWTAAWSQRSNSIIRLCFPASNTTKCIQWKNWWKCCNGAC